MAKVKSGWLVLQGRAEGITKCFERIGARRCVVAEFCKLAAEFAPVAEQFGKFRWGWFHFDEGLPFQYSADISANAF